jgi:hypothetical protein
MAAALPDRFMSPMIKRSAVVDAPSLLILSTTIWTTSFVSVRNWQPPEKQRRLDL